jgi:hypothetical protein
MMKRMMKRTMMMMRIHLSNLMVIQCNQQHYLVMMNQRRLRNQMFNLCNQMQHTSVVITTSIPSALNVRRIFICVWGADSVMKQEHSCTSITTGTTTCATRQFATIVAFVALVILKNSSMMEHTNGVASGQSRTGKRAMLVATAPSVAPAKPKRNSKMILGDLCRGDFCRFLQRMIQIQMNPLR